MCLILFSDFLTYSLIEGQTIICMQYCLPVCLIGKQYKAHCIHVNVLYVGDGVEHRAWSGSRDRQVGCFFAFQIIKDIL